MEALRKDGKDIKLLESWFKREDNAIPPMYVLQPISSHLPHYNDKVGYV